MIYKLTKRVPPPNEIYGIGHEPGGKRFQQLMRAQQLILENCTDWPADEIDEVMLFLLNHGIEEEIAETTLVHLFAA